MLPPQSSNWIQTAEKWVERHIRQNARIFARVLSTAIRYPIFQVLSATIETIVSDAINIIGLARRMVNEAWEVIRSIVDRTLLNRATRIITGLLSLGISSFGIAYVAKGIQLGAFIASLPVSLVAIPITLCAMTVSLWRDRKNLASARKKKLELQQEITDLRCLIYKERNELNRSSYIQELRRHLIQAEYQLRKTNLEIMKFQLKCASQKRSMFFLTMIFAGIIGLAFPPVGIPLIILGSLGWIHTAVKYKNEMQTLDAQITAVNLSPPSEPERESLSTTATLERDYRIRTNFMAKLAREYSARTLSSTDSKLNDNPQIATKLHCSIPDISSSLRRR